MISALFLIAGIHINLKTYEQAKIFFNPANTKSSSEESLEEKRHTFVGVFPFRMVQFANTEFLSQMTQAHSQPCQMKSLAAQQRSDNKILCFYFFVYGKGYILFQNIVWENVLYSITFLVKFFLVLHDI